jgi:NAD-dependent SIR2 family protein deacetylase
MTSPTPHEDALLTLAFSLRANPGAYAVLAGAGVSAPSGILTAWGVVKDLISRLAVLVEDEEPVDHAQWYEHRYGQPARYETLLERLAPSSLERQRLLRTYFEPADSDIGSEEKQPTIAHRSIARLVKSGSIRIIVTLNFDRLLEQAIRAEGIEPTIVASAADATGLAPLHTLDCCIVHLHGDYLNPATMLNTTTELDAYEPQMLDLLHRILRDYGLILAGWSGLYDPALVDAIKSQYPARYTLTWVEPAIQTEAATEFRTLMKGSLVPTDADTAFGFLADAVASLNSRRARHPLTVAVAAETAKRELSGQWVAIGLHDRLATEFETLHRLPEFNVQQETPDGYVSMVERVEEASKVTVALVSALGYWGDEKTDQWWIDEVERFSRQVRASGQVRLLSLRLTAGSALYYSAGIAALAAKRYTLLSQLLSHQRPNAFNDEQEKLARVLVADGALEDTPPRLYQFLHPILTESLVLGPERLEDVWQLFEVLRMSSLIITHPRFGKLKAQLATQEEALFEAYREFEGEKRHGSGKDVDAAKEKLAKALEAFNSVLDLLANLVTIHNPHLLATDHVLDERWRVPVADRIVTELKAEGDSHPLIQAAVAVDAESLSAAIRAVGAAAGRKALNLSWKGIEAVGNKVGSGLIPDEIWIDTGLTPEQLAASVCPPESPPATQKAPR